MIIVTVAKKFSSAVGGGVVVLKNGIVSKLMVVPLEVPGVEFSLMSQ